MDQGYILEVELTELTEVLDVRKKGINNDLGFWSEQPDGE